MIDHRRALNVFILGPLHGQPIPGQLIDMAAPLVMCQDQTFTYVRVLWWIGRLPGADGGQTPGWWKHYQGTTVLDNNLYKTVYVPFGSMPEDVLEAVCALGAQHSGRAGG